MSRNSGNKASISQVRVRTEPIFAEARGALAVIQAEKMKPFFVSLLYEEAWGKIGSFNGLPKKQT